MIHTINELQIIVNHTRSFNNKKDKLNYLNQQSRDVLNFLSKNIKKDGIAKTIASEIPIATLGIMSNMENIIDIFANASILSSRKDKIRLMKDIRITPENREFILTTLYGSLKLGVTIPTPEPEFGDIIKPQLCGMGIKFDPVNMVIEEKFDGIRAIATNNNSIITIQSRNGKVLNLPTIAKALKNILPLGTTVDGEIIDKSGDFQKLDRKSTNLIYQIFDIIFYNERAIIDYSLLYRKEILYEYIKENNYIKISKELNLNTIQDIDEYIEKTGAEGIVAKDLNSKYIYGNRKSWIKFKHFSDISGVVIGYTPGDGKRLGIMGAVEFLPDGFENTVFVGSGFTDQQLKEMKELIDNNNKIRIDVKYQNVTSDNKSLRFPTFLRIREINGEEI